MDSLSSGTPRRGFLGRVAALTAAAGLGNLVPTALTAEPTLPTKSANPEFEAWLKRITGKHRQVFDAPEPNNGMVAIWPRVFINTTKATYGDGEKTTAVVILRHDALPLAMDDALWSKYQFGEMFKIKDGEAAATRNPYKSITGLPITGLGIAELLKDGVLVGACDVAMTVYSSAAAKKMNMDAAEVKKEWIAGLLPGVQLVPSGVLATARTQEMGCAYCFAG